MTREIRYEFMIGGEKHVVTLVGEETEDGGVVFSADDFQKEQKKLAIALLEERRDAHGITGDLASFLVDVSGLTSSEIATFLRLSSPEVSSWRRGSPLEQTEWTLLRVFLHDYLTNGKVTHPIFIANHSVGGDLWTDEMAVR